MCVYIYNSVRNKYNTYIYTYFHRYFRAQLPWGLEGVTPPPSSIFNPPVVIFSGPLGWSVSTSHPSSAILEETIEILQ